MTPRVGGPAASYDLSGSTAFVTGAAGDIGRAVALRLAASGAQVALSDLVQASEALDSTRQQCAAVGEESAVASFTADVTDLAEVEASVAAATGRFGAPDLVFNNAGYQGVFVKGPDYPSDDFGRVLDVNVHGVFNVLQACARALRAVGKGGSIVNSASMAGVDGAANMAAYSASKAAVIGLSRAMSKDLAPLGIRVNAVSPAFIGPGIMWDRQTRLQAEAGSQYYSDDPDEVARQMIGQVPMRRCGTPEEVAATVVWLLSADAAYVTGQNIPVTGGI